MTVPTNGRSTPKYTHAGISSLYKLPGDYSQFAIVSRRERGELNRDRKGTIHLHGNIQFGWEHVRYIGAAKSSEGLFALFGARASGLNLTRLIAAEQSAFTCQLQRIPQQSKVHEGQLVGGDKALLHLIRSSLWRGFNQEERERINQGVDLCVDLLGYSPGSRRSKGPQLQTSHIEQYSEFTNTIKLIWKHKTYLQGVAL